MKDAIRARERRGPALARDEHELDLRIECIPRRSAGAIEDGPAWSSSALGVDVAGYAFATGVNAGIHAATVQFERVTYSELGGAEAHRVAAFGLSGSGSTLPHLDAIQRSFGKHDVRGVRAHVGGAASESSRALGANGYASGDAVAFANAPDLRLAAHEAAHVVQQRGGVRLSDGLGSGGDVYEQHADAVADAVVRGDSAEGLLDPFAHRGSAGGSAVQFDRRGRGGAGAEGGDAAHDEVITAPSDAPTLLRYARGVHGHLHDPPGHLVPYARALDQVLMAGGFDDRPRDVNTVVDALIAIRGALAARPPADLAPFRSGGSPLDGMIEDIAPFGNVDMWNAMRLRVRERPPAHRDPGPTTTTDPPPPPPPADGPTIGSVAGGGAADRAGRDIGEAAHADIDHTSGDISTAIDRVSLAYDGIDALVGGFGGFFGEVAMPAISPIVQAIGLFLAMDDATRRTERGTEAQGLYFGALGLGFYPAPYPTDVRGAELRDLIDDSGEFRELERMGGALYGLGGDGEREALLNSGFRRVAQSANTAVHTAEASTVVREALERADATLAARIRQDLRQNMYRRISAVALGHIAD